MYHSSNLDHWNVWGTDNVGKINANGSKFFYIKDHLGSVRMVLNSDNQIVSAIDYDCWGYPLENRSYQSDDINYKFTGKQRDAETGYDYFGARYYDARIGRWGGVDPVFTDLSLSPYNYANNAPLFFVDPNGMRVNPKIMMANDIGSYNLLIADLEYLTGLKLKLVGNYLEYVTENGSPVINGGSETARNLLMSVLDSKYVVFLVSNDEQGSYSSPAVISLDPSQINAFINGTEGLNKSTLGWAMIFLHEARHTNAGGSFKDPLNTNNPGEVEWPLNVARSEMEKNGYGKWGYRASYKGTLMTDSENNTLAYIPFSSYSKSLIGEGEIPKTDCIHFQEKFNPNKK